MVYTSSVKAYTLLHWEDLRLDSVSSGDVVHLIFGLVRVGLDSRAWSLFLRCGLAGTSQWDAWYVRKTSLPSSSARMPATLPQAHQGHSVCTQHSQPRTYKRPRGLLRIPPCRSPSQHLNLQIKATPAAPSSEFCLLSWSSQALLRPQFLMSQRGKCPQIECWVTPDPTL